jgi:hypothetical protein
VASVQEILALIVVRRATGRESVLREMELDLLLVQRNKELVIVVESVRWKAAPITFVALKLRTLSTA